MRPDPGLQIVHARLFPRPHEHDDLGWGLGGGRGGCSPGAWEIQQGLNTYLSMVELSIQESRAIRAIQKAIATANLLLDQVAECGDFVTSVMHSLPNVAPTATLANFEQKFNATNFVPTPANDVWVKANGTGYTAHVDQIGTGWTVHVDNPFRSNLASTMIHEVFHTIFFGATDQNLAAAANVKGANGMSMREASNAFSREMEKRCDPKLLKK